MPRFVGLTYKWAAAFFYEQGSTPFAFLGSGSYSLWLIAGLSVRQVGTDVMPAGMFPPVVLQGLAWVVGSVLIGYGFFLHVAIPIFFQLIRPELTVTDDADAGLDKFSLLASGTHSFVFFFGVLLRLIMQHRLQASKEVLAFAKHMVYNVCFSVVALAACCMFATSTAEPRVPEMASFVLGSLRAWALDQLQVLP